MEGFTLQETEEPGMTLSTYNPIFKYTFNWVIEKLSKYLKNTLSPRFQVEPKSRWYVLLAKDTNRIWLTLNRYSEDLHVTIHYTVRISDAVSNALYYNTGTFIPLSKDSRFHVFDNVAIDRMDKIMTPVNDKLSIKIHLEVIGQVTKEVSPARLLPLNLKSVLNIAMKTDMTVSDESQEKMDKKASMVTRSVFLANMLLRTSYGDEDEWDERSLVNMHDIVTFMNAELLKDIDFDTAAGLYKASGQYMLTNLKDECKNILFSKVTPENVQRLFDLLKNDS